MQRILITAGPTREYIDPVRFISNESSGKMGVALAEAAKGLGHKVTLILGPVAVKPPKDTKVIHVISAKEMFSAVKNEYKSANIIIMSAAVADYTPAKFSKKKLKKSCDSKVIKLKPTVDILKWLGDHKKPGQKLIGFALETNDLLKNAGIKLKKKNCDAIIANLASNIGKNKGSAIILLKDGGKQPISLQNKTSLAKKILKSILLA